MGDHRRGGVEGSQATDDGDGAAGAEGIAGVCG